MPSSESQMILAGSLRQRVTIQRPQEVRSDSGATDSVWEDWFDSWADIQAMSSRAVWNAPQVASQSTNVIRLRYRPGITAKMRVRYQRASGSPKLYDYYSIDGPPVDVNMLHHELHLFCTLREAEGFRTGKPD
jgi:SPP1 family predicted phage head-tail adaptor